MYTTLQKFLYFPKTIQYLFSLNISNHVSRDSAVSIATSYWLDDRGVGVQVQWGQEFSLLHIVQTGSGVHPTSYPMDTGGSFPRGKATGA
jgi:hypothetical protein